MISVSRINAEDAETAETAENNNGETINPKMQFSADYADFRRFFGCFLIVVGITGWVTCSISGTA